MVKINCHFSFFKLLVAIVIVLLFNTCDENRNTNAEKSECNYIDDYYQLVFEAEFAYIMEDFDKAYRLFKEAEENCPLLNQPGIYETEKLIELSIKFEDYDRLIDYLKILLENGVTFEEIERDFDIELLKKLDGWDKFELEVEDLENDFINNVNYELRKEIMEMNALDQNHRQPGNVDHQLMQRADSINEKRIKEIFSEYGYPNDKLIGRHIMGDRTSITAMLMHFDDTAYFRPVLMKFIERGESPPVLGNMIDSRLRGTGSYLYGIYNNVDSTKIHDFENLDKRRISIGLRPWKMEQERLDLLMKRMGADH